MTALKSSGRLCPLVKRPQKECYCRNITSSTVEAAILFCMGEFTECEIYKRTKDTGVLDAV